MVRVEVMVHFKVKLQVRHISLNFGILRIIMVMKLLLEGMKPCRGILITSASLLVQVWNPSMYCLKFTSLQSTQGVFRGSHRIW